MLDVINQLPERNRFFRGLRAWSGFHQAGVVYERDARAAGDSKYSLRKLIKLGSDGIFNFSTIPLTAVFYVGSLMASVSIAALLLVLILRVFDIPIFGMRASDVQGFSSTILTVLLIGGIQLVLWIKHMIHRRPSRRRGLASASLAASESSDWI